MDRLTYLEDGQWKMDIGGAVYAAPFVDQIAGYEDALHIGKGENPKQTMMECRLGTQRIMPGTAFYQPLAGQVILWHVEEISVTGRGSSFCCYADPDSEEWFFDSDIGRLIFYERAEAEKLAADDAERGEGGL